MMETINIFKNTNELIAAVATDICEVAAESIKKYGRFNFVLSGGNSPKKLYESLASEPFRDRIDWEKTYFFFGDERFVPENDAERNSLMVEKALFLPLNIKKSHIFKVDTTTSPQESAQKYWDTIAKHFDGKPVEFDYNLLGLGDDAHTASLFPSTQVLDEKKPTIKSVFAPEAQMYRITMTAPLINQSKRIAFLVYGGNKADAVFHVLKDSSAEPEKFPARLISTDEGKVRWFLDQDAASRLLGNHNTKSPTKNN